jgi:ribosomal protein S18 acetylase RimI-like enzyme
MDARVRTENWAGSDAATVRTLVEREMRAYLDELGWDVSGPWAVVDPARRTGQLPGLLARDQVGRPLGWTAYLALEGHLQVMAIAAADAETTAVLVDGILAAPQVRDCRSVIVCVRDAAAPRLPDTLTSRGFRVEAYRYLVKPLTDADRQQVPAAIVQPWNGRRHAMALLCERAYRDAPGVRAFAPDGTLAQWRAYVDSLIDGNGCGEFLPHLSRVVAGGVAGRRLLAGAMLSDLGTGTVHLSQLAVDPSIRRKGLARATVTDALAEASRTFVRASLLVSSSNGAAARLYESMGFRDHASFVVAQRYRV